MLCIIDVMGEWVMGKMQKKLGELLVRGKLLELVAGNLSESDPKNHSH